MRIEKVGGAMDVSVSAVVSVVDEESVTVDLTATSAGVKVLGMAKATVLR